MNNSETTKTIFKPALIGVVLVVLALVVYFAWPSSDTDITSIEPVAATEPSPPKPAVAPTPQPLPTEPVAVTKPEPVEPTISVPSITAAPIPSLNNSDDYARKELDETFESSGINKWLPDNDLVRRFVIFVDSISGGNLIRGQLEHVPVTGKFGAIETRPGHYRLDPESYHRYDALTEFFVELDSKEIIRLYQENRSLVSKAYRELGNPQTDFDKVFIRAIDQVMVTPELEGDIELIRPSVAYRFEDKQLEQLSKVQKQLIRMGPENTRAIKQKLSEIRLLLQ
ncbi:MAG: DUF3014 domain-containing protein [Pseudomonadales bacterium]|nr:DUF3014 domain-containing protein [Pseudomonadales bacterium]